ncbi:MAG: hypothetical protein GY874_15290 [Desulfobacteraceae bacterium]|nr:hypothetical protein [Desulfobacteraceae bacterium]
MKLKEKIEAYKESFKTNAPKKVQTLIQRATDDLTNSGILSRVVKKGAPAPKFTLENINKTQVSLSSLLSKGPLVLGFFRGRW